MALYRPRTGSTLSHSYYALTVLVAVNLLNYVDRQVLYAVFPLVKADLQLSDTALGLLGSAFMLCYMVSAPLLAGLGDRISRVRLAAAGLSLWSLATVSAGFASHYMTLVAARMVVGIGEASFGTISPGLVSDYFARGQRGRILSYFYLAIPVGSALGYLIGGLMGQHFGWHSAFLLVGLPGLLLAVPLALLPEPPRGGSAAAKGHAAELSYPAWSALLANYSFVTTTLASTALTFALGGLAQWVPTFLYRWYGLDVGAGNTLFGAITVIAGITGTLTGGWLGDRLQRQRVTGYLVVSGSGLLLGAPLVVWALLTPSLPACLTAIFCAECLLFLNTGPLNTVIVNVIAPTLRARAFAVNIFVIHALGDAISPTLLGYLSDLWGLRNALLITPLAIALAAAFTFLAMRFIARDNRED
jgi:MFS family permease